MLLRHMMRYHWVGSPGQWLVGGVQGHSQQTPRRVVRQVKQMDIYPLMHLMRLEAGRYLHDRSRSRTTGRNVTHAVWGVVIGVVIVLMERLLRGKGCLVFVA